MVKSHLSPGNARLVFTALTSMEITPRPERTVGIPRALPNGRWDFQLNFDPTFGIGCNFALARCTERAKPNAYPARDEYPSFPASGKDSRAE